MAALAIACLIYRNPGTSVINLQQLPLFPYHDDHSLSTNSQRERTGIAAPAALKADVTLRQGTPEHGFLSSFFHSAQCYALCLSAVIAIIMSVGMPNSPSYLWKDNLIKQWYVYLFLKECHFNVFLIEKGCCLYNYRIYS